MKGLWKWGISLTFEVIAVLLLMAWAERYISISHNLLDPYTFLLYLSGRLSVGIADYFK